MMKETIEIRGNPKGFQMPRATIQKAAHQTESVKCSQCGAWIFIPKKFAMMYDPQGKDKRAIRQIVQEKAPPVPFQNPCALKITAYLPIPKHTPQWKLEFMRTGWIRPRVKPDSTNILKLYEDALTGIWFRDDALVVDTTVKKLYGTTPRIEIEVMELVDFGAMKRDEAKQVWADMMGVRI